MTISKGSAWGEAIERPDELRVATSDAEFVELIETAATPAVTLAGGELFRALGSPPPRRDMMALPIDLIDVSLDGDKWCAVSNVYIRRPMRSGGVAAGDVIWVSNTGYVGERNVAPKAHPNDGKLDVIHVAASMGVRQRFEARRRSTTGTHIPHPQIEYRQVESAAWTFDRAMVATCDGGRSRRVREVVVRVLPDAATVVV